MRVSVIAAAISTLTLSAGCAGGGGAPSRFRGPVVSSVSVDPVLRPPPEPVVSEPEPRPSPQPRPTVSRMIHKPVTVSGAPYRATNATNAGVRTIVAQAPSPAVHGTSAALVGKLRALVGVRDKKSTHVRFVINTLRRLGASVPRVVNANALVKTAKARKALMTTGHPRLGDIIVFNKFIRRKPNSMTAIVVTIDQRNTVEFIYLARNIVRRGFLNLTKPRRKRDSAGKVMNTILRHLQSGDSSRTAYLSGQLFSSYISLRKLTR